MPQRSPVFRSRNRRFQTTTTTQAQNFRQPTDAQKTKFSIKIGIDTDTLKSIFDQEPTKRTDKQAKLVRLICNRIKDGRTKNLKDYRIWAAIDEAYQAPFNQTTPTLIGKILSKNLKEEDILKELALWGLSEDTLFCNVEITDELGNKRSVRQINEQTFYKTLVPLVKSYVTIRLAKLYNDRNQYPFLKFEPARFTEDNRIICEILTDLVQRMAVQYGFPAVLRQALLQALMYSIALVFPAEAWSYEKDLDESGNEFTKREGLRYNIPHPSRMFWDMNNRPSTFNTDTGCEWAGYWRLARYSEIENSSKFWNRAKIPYGTNWFHDTVSGNYFTEIYPCVAQPPLPATQADWTSRESAAAMYNTNDGDKAIFLCDFFIKLVPKDWDLGDWKYPVWFRFVVASDDAVVFAEPLPYCPVLYLGYDADEGRARNPSMALEIIPWQDHLGNVISQILLSAKQNLAKIIYYDTEVVSADDIKRLKTQSKDSSGLQFVPYSSKKARVNNADPRTNFVPIQFPQLDTTAMTNVIGTVISIMERLLGMSSSEVGAPGAHVQTAEEIRVISTNTSTRVDYTATFVDDFVEAWKRQIFDASRAFMDEEFLAQVSAVSPEQVAKLKKIGFVLKTEPYEGKVVVTVKRSMLSIDAFASSRDGQNRINSPQIAQVMMQTIQAIAGNQQLSQLIGGEQILEALNKAAVLAGAPKDFKFRVDRQGQMLAESQAMLQKIAQQIEEAAVQKSMQATQPLVKAVEGQAKAIEQIAQQTEQAAGMAQQVAQQNQGEQQAIQAIAAQVKKLSLLVRAAVQQSLPAPSAATYDATA